MRFLKVLVIVFCCTMFVSNANAQSEPVEPSFSMAISFGFPTSLHFFARDIGVQGLGIRADIGGVYFFFFGWFEAALNLEYHFSTPVLAGWYVGTGVILYKDLVGQIEPPMTPIYNEFGWKIGGQFYIGSEGERAFIEIGITTIYEFRQAGEFRFIPRFLLGFKF